eukprot:TRINITY_DN7526_c0_g2_i1.p1 TRINITY_DN7526_c0_g2~~TRINITY_DN7526_c0_g2_i1.p1  ORF type:complete len:731 (+),score=195.53 TRINITY_DN7526_c0_g2_i1:57-2195(+)
MRGKNKSKQKGGQLGGKQRRELVKEDYVYDDVEKFAASKDFIEIDPLINNKKKKNFSAIDELADEEVVMGLEGVDTESEDYEDPPSDDNDDDNLDQDLMAGGKLSKLAEVEKKIGRKLKARQVGEFEDISDEEQEDEEIPTGWGRKKKDYYTQQDVSDDDEELQLLEEEARRIQKQNLKDLDEADFGLDDEDNDSDEDNQANQDETLQQKANKLENGHVHMESVEADLEQIPEEEKLAAVQRDAPELIVLLKDLSSCLEEVRQKVGPLFSEVQQGNLATEDGISYLEAKHLLMLSYCINIGFYLLLKSEGRSVKDHPVIEKMVKIRAYLERIRPLDKKLQHQVDRLLRAAQMAQTGVGDLENGDFEVDDPQFLAPNPDNLVSKLPSKTANQSEVDMNAIYEPPKMNPVAMEGDDAINKTSKQRFQERMERRRASQSDTLQILSREIRGAPEETGVGGTDALEVGGAVSTNLQLLAQRRKLEAREKIEEDKMTRVPLTKDEKKKLKAAKMLGRNTLAAFDDFADEVNDLVSAAKTDSKLTKARPIGLTEEKSGGLTSLGDEDDPSNPPLDSRRQKFDEARLKHFESSEQQQQISGSKRDFEDMGEFVEEELINQQKPKKLKKINQNISQTLPPRPDPTTKGAREINRAIKKNQGLTPYRKKELKNPRKKNRLMHQKALKRRSGQVQTMRSQQAPYEGEKSGIKANVVRGRKLT